MEFCSESLEIYLQKRNQKPGYSFTTSQTGAVIDREVNFHIFSQVINGLVEVHKNNVIHNDLKPDNIFIDKKEDSPMIAKIGDFGLARMLTNSTSEGELSTLSNTAMNDSPDRRTKSKSSTIISRFSSVAGTEAYMAPEIKTHFIKGTCPQKYGDLEVNKKQDIFSIGLILYEICHKMKTHMERNKLFRDLQIKRELSK
jgi:translation initiation factor 2-alpha kinase 4